MATSWYYQFKGEKAGPVSPGELLQKAEAGEIAPDTLVWRRGMRRWVPARDVKGLFDAEPRSEPEEPAVRAGKQGTPPTAGPSQTVLVATNLVPIVGVLLLGWDAFSVVALYWMENGVIGLFNVLKMAWSGKEATHALKAFLIAFFALHYSGFMLAHGFFIVGLFAVARSGFGTTGKIESAFVEVLTSALSWSMFVALGFFFFEHARSFYLDYVRGGQAARTFAAVQMFEPYRYIAVLHVALIVGAVAVVAVSLPRLTAVLLVLMKTALELVLQKRKQRKRLAGIKEDHPAAG